MYYLYTSFLITFNRQEQSKDTSLCRNGSCSLHCAHSLLWHVHSVCKVRKTDFSHLVPFLTRVFVFRKAKLSNLDLFSECFGNHTKWQQNLSYFWASVLTSELGVQTLGHVWLHLSLIFSSCVWIESLIDYYLTLMEAWLLGLWEDSLCCFVIKLHFWH